MKVIAFYLPQFHPIPENDKWWGKGFTEWTNITKARPLFAGHFQPRLPADLGFYDLRLSEVRNEQARLAKEYGVHGFCYHYYWFNGKKLLDLPLRKMLETKEPDFPFCICYANENWTRRWDGLENDILIEQEHSPENDRNFIKDIIPVLRDKRYIKIGNKPLILVYRAKLFPDPLKTTAVWREEAKKAGIEDLLLSKCQSFGDFDDPREAGFDASVEFPPHGLNIEESKEYRDTIKSFVPNFNGRIFDYSDVAIQLMNREWPSYKLFKTVMLGWDNTARRREFPSIFHNFSIDFYERWLSNILKRTIERYSEDERLVFINAWNEWGEGTYLEPDQKFGIEYLRATKRAIQSASGWKEVQRCFNEFVEYANLNKAKNRGVLDYLSRYTIEYSLAKRLGDKEEELFKNECRKAALETIMRDKDAHIGNLETAIKDKDAHIGNLETTIKNKDIYIGNIETAIKNKDVHIGNLETAIKDKDIHIGNLETHVKNVEAYMKGLQTHIDNVEAHARNLETAIKDKDAHIGNLETHVKNVEAYMKGLQTHIDNVEAHARNLETAIKDKDAHIGNLETIVGNKDMHIWNIESLLKEKETTLNDIYMSRGWKLLLSYYKIRDKIFG